MHPEILLVFMKIVVDKKIPYLKGLLESVAEVIYMSGKEIRNADLVDADAMLIRTRTICNRELLEGTSIKFIGTATIGYDHIDSDFCEFSNIKWVNAPGCNSSAVAQYVTSSLLALANKYNFELSGKTLGIIGVGQVGQKVERNARLLGMNVLLNDPPRSRNEGEKNFNSLERLLEDSDIITLHTTLEKEGPDKTLHMIDETFLSRLKKPIFLINSSRGDVVDTYALKKAIKYGKVINCAIDCWENEPEIDRELLKKCYITTPHIAGYSSDGKANATRAIVEQLNSFFQLNLPRFLPELPVPEDPVLKVSKNCHNKIASALLHAYNPVIDSDKLKKNPEKFEELRDKYVFRRENKAFRVLNLNNKDAELIRAFGFQVPIRTNEEERVEE